MHLAQAFPPLKGFAVLTEGKGEPTPNTGADPRGCPGLRVVSCVGLDGYAPGMGQLRRVSLPGVGGKGGRQQKPSGLLGAMGSCRAPGDWLQEASAGRGGTGFENCPCEVFRVLSLPLRME